MSIFKKIFKGIKKVFKKIGRGIKKAFKAFGKFMGKIGFVGQMALMFLFPGGIGALLTKGLGKLGATLSAVGGANATGIAKAIQGVGNVLTKTQQFVSKAKAGFSSLTDGLKEFGKTALNKIPGVNIDGAAKNFFGTDSAFSRTTEGFQESVGGLREAFDKGTMEITEKTSLKDLSNRLGITQQDLKRLNPALENILDKDGFITPTEGAFNLNVDLASGVRDGFTVSSSESAKNLQEAILSPDDPSSFIGTGGSPTPSSIDIGTPQGQAQAFENISKAYPDIGTPPSIDIGTAQGQAQAYRNLQQTYTSLGDTPLEALNEQTKNVMDFSPNAKKGAREQMSLDNLNNKATEVAASNQEKGWFRRGFGKTVEQFDPGRVGFLQSATNIQSAAQQFASVEEPSSYGYGPGLQDYHSGYPTYQPTLAASDTMPMAANNFGAPSINEMLQLYGIYSPTTA